ncbi:MAG: AMP-binding protein [Pseudomonadales bacterium]
MRDQQSKLRESYLRGRNDQPLIDQTIGQYFNAIADKWPEEEALVVKHQNIRWSYSEYRQQIDALATGLLHLGIEKGDRVGIWAPNCVEWVLTQFATAEIGAIMVCINPAYRLYELEYALNKAGCKAIVVAESFKTSKYLDMLNTLAPELSTCTPGQLHAEKLPQLEIVIRMGEDSTAGMMNFPTVCALGEELDYQRLETLTNELSCDDAINIQFTSGTTGNPKGATLSHHNILNNADLVAKGFGLTQTDRLCIPVPLYHCFGMVMGSLACVTQGATAVFPCAAFEPEATLRTVEEERCTGLHGVPTMFTTELECDDFVSFDLTSLRTGVIAGSICPEPLMRRIVDDMNMRDITIMYGQTETSPVNHMTAATDPFEKRVSTVGRAAPHCEIKVINEAGKIAAIGEKGEVCCRGYGVMKGYWDEEERTAETIDAEGWLHSGDIGVMDEEGFVQIVGRIKDMIIRGGENVYPAEVEEFLYTHPAIKDVQVFGMEDAKYGEEVCAWITLKEGESENVNEQDIKDFCKDQITHFKVPKNIRFVSEFPMTVTGKIQKYKMRDAMKKCS